MTPLDIQEAAREMARAAIKAAPLQIDGRTAANIEAAIRTAVEMWLVADEDDPDSDTCRHGIYKAGERRSLSCADCLESEVGRMLDAEEQAAEWKEEDSNESA